MKLLSGDFAEDELQRAGAHRLYADPLDLLKHMDEVGIASAINYCLAGAAI
jgi:hypothetical protein